MNAELMDKLISLCKRRGFIFPGSEIYGGLQNSWDYGPLGAQLKKNIKDEWWRRFVERRTDMVGLDAAIIMNPKVWEASGHLKTFSDPLIECKKCHERFRADLLPIIQKDLSAILKEFDVLFYNHLDNSDSSLAEARKLGTAFDSIFESQKKAELTEEEKAALRLTLENVLKIMKSKIDEAQGHTNRAKAVNETLKESKRYQGQIMQIYLNRYIPCPNCMTLGAWEMPKQFNLMMKTHLGPTEEEASTVYFRPEIAQAMFVDFKTVLDTTRKRLPFGIASQGRAFRNEITPGNFIFRTREFDLMELEYFVNPRDWEKHFDYWLAEMKRWVKDLGVSEKKLHYVEVSPEDRAHYSKRTVDIEYDYPFGQKELYGLAYRGDFDLSNHASVTREDLDYTDPDTNEKFTPHVIEPTFGLDRSVLVALLEAYTEESLPSEASAKEGADLRVVLKFPAWVAPVKVAILPLSKKDELSAIAKPLLESLSKHFVCEYDETQSIGKRYRRQDEIGTPFCVTVDFETINDQAVTVRDRDTMKQERIPLADLEAYLKNKLQ